MEDPLHALETLAPYVLTSHTRDGAVRGCPEGAEVAWTRMGNGNVGIDRYLDAFRRRCPALPVMLEIIVMPGPRPLPFRDPAFWDGYRDMRASEFQQFVDLVHRAGEVPLPGGPVDAAAELANVEASIQWTREYLGRPSADGRR